MDGGGERRRETLVLVVIVVLAAMAVSALLVAIGYYWYIRSKVSRHRKSLDCKLPFPFPRCHSQTDREKYCSALFVPVVNRESRVVRGGGGLGEGRRQRKTSNRWRRRDRSSGEREGTAGVHLQTAPDCDGGLRQGQCGGTGELRIGLQGVAPRREEDRRQAHGSLGEARS